MNFTEGEILYFDKPFTWTSFNLVAKVRWILCKKLGVKKLKVGHAGTLDPLATGVMAICTGRATKRINELQNHTKEYVATLQLGATTPSFDLEKPIEQIPPSFSACKVDGKRAYDLARKGKEVELKPKILVIDEIELLEFSPDTMQMTIRVVCSKGTYIRALARDIGLELGSGAHLIALRRTKINNVRAEDCMKIEDFPQWLDQQEIEDHKTKE